MTDRDKTGEQLPSEPAEMARLLRAMLENIPVDFWARDSQGRCFLQSRVSRETWGNLTGGLGSENIPSQTSAQWQANNQRVLRGEVVREETQLVTADGQRRDFLNIVAPILDGGSVQGCFGINIDVTARKQAEAALRASETKYRNLLEHMPDFVVVVDRDAKILFANRPAAGASVPELVGSTGFDHIAPEHRAACRAAFQRALATGEVQSVELLDVYGTWFRSRVVPLLDAEGEAKAMVISADITRRKSAEAATQEKQRLLQQALEVYEQHRQLAAYEIHDGLAQPLAGALMNLDASLRHLDAQRLEAARDGLAKTRQLVQDTIGQARRLMNGLRPLVLDELGILPAIDHLVYEHRSAGIVAVQYTQSVQFTRLAPPLETALFRIIQEGLANAERHSQSGTVRLALIQQGDRVRVEVEDWGVGFDPARVEQGPFGLKGIRERAQLFGGSATFQSAPGRGTRITVELPLVEAVPKSAWDAT